MKKLAILFVIAVLIPSMVLGWLALRSVHHQQIIIERQRSLIYQAVVDSVARQVRERLLEEQGRFATAVAALLKNEGARERLPWSFDKDIRGTWEFAKIGFAVSSRGTLLSPSPHSSPEAALFVEANAGFLANRDAAPVYQNTFKIQAMSQQAAGSSFDQMQKLRSVSPQNAIAEQTAAGTQQLSKFVPLETEFRKVVGEGEQGMIARFLNNKLNLLVWHRPPSASNVIYGAEVDLEKMVSELEPILRSKSGFAGEICVALLNDAAKPVALSKDGFEAHWKRPFVASEIGEELPHWEIAAYLVNPAQLEQTAQTTRLMLGLLIAILVTAIAVGAWLIITDMNRQMRLARLKTDFVSNVSHELKTPLTSIRMFSELLADGRVTEPEKQRSYLGIIQLEAARLSRLINNVLDFARMERGEKHYQLSRFDFAAMAREMCETYRAQLEQGGFVLACRISTESVWVDGDRDALAQIIVNLLSNAEKYSEARKEITVSLDVAPTNRTMRFTVADRGIGVPAGCEEKIFEQFYRAHDALNSNTHGTGLGLTLARQIARAHKGDVVYRRRNSGGSCFTLELPIA